MQKINEKLLSFASVIDPQTLKQAELTSSMPFIQPHLALMPDAHLGLGATVGSVIPTIGAIIPAAVGVDIGCGMIAVRTQFHKDDLRDKDLKKLHHSITRSIPLSAGGYNRNITPTAQKRIDALKFAGVSFGQQDLYEGYGDWQHQLGSLGSGNHFIEVSLDENDNVWLFLHSGSRGVGNKIAQHHIKIAKETMRKWLIQLPHEDLAYLVEGTDEFDRYMFDLIWAQAFALANRDEMMDRVIKDLCYFMGTDVEEKERINCHHNFTSREHHLGHDMLVSRWVLS